MSLQMRPSGSFSAKARELSDKGLNQVTTGFFQGLSTSNIRAVSFRELRIKVVVANKQAELITQSGLRVAWPVRSRNDRRP